MADLLRPLNQEIQSPGSGVVPTCASVAGRVVHCCWRPGTSYSTPSSRCRGAYWRGADRGSGSLNPLLSIRGRGAPPN